MRALTIPGAATQPRFMPVIGDGMAPTLKPGNLVAVVPVDTYVGPGVYVFDVLGTADMRRCEKRIGESGIRVWHDNQAYSGSTVTPDWFEGAVIGKVAGRLDMVDPVLLTGAENPSARPFRWPDSLFPRQPKPDPQPSGPNNLPASARRRRG